MPKKRKLKPKATIRGLRRFYEKTLRSLEAELASAQHRLAGYEEKERWRRREEEVNWDAYDRAVDAVTQHERELFEASPAYQKYQQWRATQGLVKKGDWRAP